MGALRFEINRSAIASVHVEGDGSMIMDDAPLPVPLEKTDRGRGTKDLDLRRPVGRASC